MGEKQEKLVLEDERPGDVTPLAGARRWQAEAAAAWDGRSRPDFLITATPGSGKTRLAVTLALALLARRSVERVAVVVPTEHLRRQWADAAHGLGLSLDPKFSNGDGWEVSADFAGVCVTYQQVTAAPGVFRTQCERRKTLVVFDEIHHAGDDLAWGAALRHAFEPATERLALSGTPFRSDNCPIPFVTYCEGRSRADFTYSYSEALADGVCAPIYFPTLNGRAKWLSRDRSYRDCWLLDDIPAPQSRERLRTILDTRGGWMRRALEAAAEELTRVRSSGHPRAGALVVAIDQEHAKRIARLLRDVTGEESTVAISEDPGASAKIQQYAEGDGRFLVCVRMVSEGVDIPRLKVGVYATVVSSELFLRQLAGRFVRGPGSATLYIPAVEPLITYARQIKEERDHVLAEAARQQPAAGVGGADQSGGTFEPLGASSREHDTIYDGQTFSVAELAYARRIARELGIIMDPPVLAALLRRHAADAGVFVTHRAQDEALREGSETPPDWSDELLESEGGDTSAHVVPPQPPPEPVYRRKESVRKQIQRAAAQLAGLMGVRPFVINKQWIESGGAAHGEATEADLLRKLAYLRERIREEREGRR